MWAAYKKGFKAYLQLEKSLSENSVDAYIHDIEKFTQFLSLKNSEKSPKDIELADLETVFPEICRIHDVTFRFEHQLDALGGVRIVFDQQNAHGTTPRNPFTPAVLTCEY